MSYLFPSLLTLGLPLVALPLIIHLINLRRRRRVAWAAMDFLLESQKRHKKWILLRQLLLLALRTAAVACIVLMLAGPVVRSTWASLFGEGVTHHLLLLDDSYSMSDALADRSVWDEAKRVAQRIVDAASQRPGRQAVTLLTFSTARTLAAGETPDIHQEPLSDDLRARLGELLPDLRATETSAGPLDALAAVQRLPGAAEDETRIVYLLSDFRQPQWNDAAALAQQAAKVREQASQLQLVHCAEQRHANLTLSRLEPVAGLRAAGVETWMQVGVQNHGDAPAPAVAVELRHNDARLPAVQFDEIPPGVEEVRQFRVTLSADGSRLEADLPQDALVADNRRYFAAAPPAAFPVLIIDESERGEDGKYFAAALDPGGRNLSGWNPVVERSRFLGANASLDRFAAICLLDVARLEPNELDSLTRYVESGGGIAWFVGPRTQPSFVNETLYRAGTGWFPAPLATPRQLVASGESGVADLQVGADDLFRVFQGQRNSFLSLVRFDFYYALDPGWQAPEDGSVEILARLRNQAPLVMRRRFGDGQAVVQLCRVSPLPSDLGAWSNLSLNPAFPVYANELIGKLSAERRMAAGQSTSAPLAATAPLAEYLASAAVRPPATASQPPATIDAQSDGDLWRIEIPAPLASGVWETTWTPRAAEAVEGAPSAAPVRPLRQLTAVNVDPREGDLRFLDEQQLREALPGVDWQFARASQFSEVGDELAGYNLTTALIAALAVLLVGEQLAAFAASYHAAERSVAT